MFDSFLKKDPFWKRGVKGLISILILFSPFLFFLFLGIMAGCDGWDKLYVSNASFDKIMLDSFDVEIIKPWFGRGNEDLFVVSRRTNKQYSIQRTIYPDGMTIGTLYDQLSQSSKGVVWVTKGTTWVYGFETETYSIPISLGMVALQKEGERDLIIALCFLLVGGSPILVLSIWAFVKQLGIWLRNRKKGSVISQLMRLSRI